MTLVKIKYWKQRQVHSGAYNELHVSCIFNIGSYIQIPVLLWYCMSIDILSKETHWEYNRSSWMKKKTHANATWWRNVTILVLDIFNMTSQFLSHWSGWQRWKKKSVFRLWSSRFLETRPYTVVSPDVYLLLIWECSLADG